MKRGFMRVFFFFFLRLTSKPHEEGRTCPSKQTCRLMSVRQDVTECREKVLQHQKWSHVLNVRVIAAFSGTFRNGHVDVNTAAGDCGHYKSLTSRLELTAWKILKDSSHRRQARAHDELHPPPCIHEDIFSKKKKPVTCIFLRWETLDTLH